MNMAKLTNEQILLNDLLSQRKASVAEDMSDAEFFELFAAEQLLKDFDVSYDEIASGIVDGAGDGGIDCIYTFVNGELIEEDTDLSSFDKQKKISIDLLIVQAKNENGFKEDALDKLRSVSEACLNLGTDLDSLKSVYNSDVRNKFELFRTAFRKLGSKFPNISIRYAYCTKTGGKPHTNVQRKCDPIIRMASTLFSQGTCSVEFLGASELLELARQRPSTSVSLKLAENPITSGDKNFIGLVPLDEYYRFISDNGKLRRHLLEANVRDYLGSVDVNQDIRDSLNDSGHDDFWWLNNGVTIVASDAMLTSGKMITMEDPQVVNGLQTTTEIFNHFLARETKEDKRSLLVRVLVPKATESRDRIIWSTNNQTKIPSASLRATERIHRDIEQYLLPYGLFYDRRKNFYKNEGKPVKQIIGIPQMAQAVMALALQRPDTARARPSSLLKSDDGYTQIFNSSYPIHLYLVCPRIVSVVDLALSSNDDISKKEKYNIRYMVGMVASVLATKTVRPSVDVLSKLTQSQFDENLMETAINLVLTRFREMGGNDQAAKGSAFLEAVHADLKPLLVRAKRAPRSARQRS